MVTETYSPSGKYLARHSNTFANEKFPPKRKISFQANGLNNTPSHPITMLKKNENVFNQEATLNIEMGKGGGRQGGRRGEECKRP